MDDGNCSSLGRKSSGPPSRDSETWTFVSLVMRSMNAVRAAAAVLEEPMCGKLFGGGSFIFSKYQKCTEREEWLIDAGFCC